tara:strand:- start:154 stop:345 length:192 start_codon:yes stop_codon:yes gene_type:complete
VEETTHQKDQVILLLQVHHKVMLVEKDVIYPVALAEAVVELELLEQTQEVIMVELAVLVLQTI